MGSGNCYQHFHSRWNQSIHQTIIESTSAGVGGAYRPGLSTSWGCFPITSSYLLPCAGECHRMLCTSIGVYFYYTSHFKYCLRHFKYCTSTSAVYIAARKLLPYVVAILLGILFPVVTSRIFEEICITHSSNSKQAIHCYVFQRHPTSPPHYHLQILCRWPVKVFQKKIINLTYWRLPVNYLVIRRRCQGVLHDVPRRTVPGERPE